MIYIYSGAIEIKCKKLFPRLLTLQTSTDAIVRSLTSRKMGKLYPMEREFMVHDKCYKEYTHLPKDKTVRYHKFPIENVNTTYYFFTINVCKNFLELF